MYRWPLLLSTAVILQLWPEKALVTEKHIIIRIIWRWLIPLSHWSNSNQAKFTVTRVEAGYNDSMSELYSASPAVAIAVTWCVVLTHSRWIYSKLSSHWTPDLLGTWLVLRNQQITTYPARFVRGQSAQACFGLLEPLHQPQSLVIAIGVICMWLVCDSHWSTYNSGSKLA